MTAGIKHREGALSPYLSPFGAWAFALGTAIGWGSLVVTSNTYLRQAGPWGSVAGMLLGAIVMLLVARNYHYLVNCFPDSGGAYTYTKEVFGHDFGFVTAWFLALTYIAIFWANVTSLPLFAHYFLGDIFKVGFLYTIFGYDVYLGEALLCIAAIVLTALVCTCSRKAVMYVMIGLALLFTVGIVACFIAAFAGTAGSLAAVAPGFIPDKTAVSQVLLIACISPWAFIGFENISNSSEEFSFKRAKTFRIMLAAILTATTLYVCVLLLSVTAFPPEYSSWLDYISNLGELDGIKALPAFYAARHYLGDAGIVLLMLALLALVLTSLVCNVIALSRLFRALAKDSVLPRRFAYINGFGTPSKAILLIAVASFAIPFLGRTAIGWIVDVTTIGATIIYGFVSASAARVARARGDGVERFTGLAGAALMIVFGAYLLIPSLFLSRTLEPESYFLFAAWSILGFMFFRILLGKDETHRYGQSVVVWIALLSLVMFVSFVWMNQSLMRVADGTVEQISAHYYVESGSGTTARTGQAYLDQQQQEMDSSNVGILLTTAGMLGLASALLLTNFSYMSRRARESEEELNVTREVIYTDPLTGLPSMSRFHELAREGAEAIRAQDGRPTAVALDLVGMKDFNAKHGRDEGDALLRAFADVLAENFGPQACSRFAEDHFYTYAPLDGLVERIEAVFASFRSNEDGKTLPVRTGAYICMPDDDIVAVGFDRARSACDSDRKTWQSHLVWFSDVMSDEARQRLHVLDNLDKAVEEGWIRPHYQAIVSAGTGKVCGEEALARWTDPEHGELAPGQFIPVLEEAGLLHKVDMHMLDCVIEDMFAKRARGVALVPVSVNISLRDMSHIDVADEIVKRVDAAGVPHSLVRIEFTESVASEDPALFKREVDTLRASGFEVWMDDFGSGYSSLNSLKDFTFDLVKLDMEFMRGSSNEKTWDIIAGVVQINQSIGARSLAEGIETEEQAQRLKDIGCDMLQGYFFSRPMSLDAVVRHGEAGDSFPREEPEGVRSWMPA